MMLLDTKCLLFPCETLVEIIKFLTRWLPVEAPMSSRIMQASFSLGENKSLCNRALQKVYCTVLQLFLGVQRHPMTNYFVL